MKTIFIKKEALNDIISGDKIYELRLKKPFFTNIYVGEKILFKDLNRSLKCSIENIIIFNDLNEVFDELNYFDFNKRSSCKEETIKLYHTIYSKFEIPILVFKIKKEE